MHDKTYRETKLGVHGRIPARSELPPVGRVAPYATVAYLDSWVWVQLTRARRDSEHPLHQAARQIQAAVDTEKLQIVLGSGNYMEIWNKANTRARRDVARTMADFSRYATLRAIHEVVDAEFNHLVSNWRARGFATSLEPLSRDWIVNIGARHAFASRSGRFRFVDSLASSDSDEGPEIETPQEWSTLFDALPPDAFEWINLAGVDLAYDIEGIDYRPSHRDGGEWAAVQEALRRRSWAVHADGSHLYRAIVERQLQIVLGQVELPESARRIVLGWLNGPVSVMALITALPTQQVITELLLSVHRDQAYTFRQHDRVDVQELALAVPYCDVVIPDAHWAHQLVATGVSESFNTRVIRGQKAVATWAASL